MSEKREPIYENYAINGPGICIDMCGDPILLECNGKTYRYEWHTYHGPTFLTKGDEPMKVQPGERNPVWKAIQAWAMQGRKVVDGKAVWTPIPGRNVTVRRIDFANVEIVPDGTTGPDIDIIGLD